MDQEALKNLQADYDRLAREYAERLSSELDHKPLDRELLDRFADRVKPLGPVCDLGCGPGHVARYLHARGVDVFGIDLSAGMIEQARLLNPELEFRQGNMLSLDIPDDSLGGIAAFYSIIHIPRNEVTGALVELKRTLRPGGLLFAAFHIGDEVLHRDELWGQPISIDFIFFQPEEMRRYLEQAGFRIEETVEREPYEDVEYPSRRAYIFAKKPEDR